MSVSFSLMLVLVAACGAAAWIFNQLVRDRNQVTAAWADIDVQLQKRHDLVPPLVESARGYVKHEAELLERLARERAESRSTQAVAAKSEVERRLGDDLSRLIALAEDYPQLRASENFAQLSSELVKVEDDLQYARRFYNGSVRQLNTRIQVFPHVLIARSFGFREAEHFDAVESARINPEVKL